jgi:hypothetical protein
VRIIIQVNLSINALLEEEEKAHIYIGALAGYE